MRKSASRVLAASFLSLTMVGSSIAQTISNPSFEADTFTVFPGYISGNSPITGWTAGDANRAGINPGGGSPFADNGTIPAGSQVAFIQNGANSSLSTVISGLTAGQTYKVNFRVNARNGNTPNLKVDIDGNNIINTAVTSVGGSNPYKYFAFDFTATAASHTMRLRNDAGADHTVVIDDFSVALRNSGWSFAAWNDDATSGVDGSKTYTHAYSFGSAVNTTINGILFTGIGGVNPSGATFSTTGLGAAFVNDVNNLTGGSDQLANDFVYNGFPATITINGLIPGAEYLATIYSVGWENGTRAATFSVGNDRLTINQDHFGDNNGIRFIYHYIATGSSITLTYSPLQANSIHTYGFSNYQLAAPPTPPAIVTSPKSRCVSEGQPFTLSGSASGAPIPSYRWQKDGADISGATSSSLTISSASSADAGGYTLIASNASGTATSAVAMVKVGLPLANPSFEADTFTTYPGYVSGNGPITGWSALPNHGINPGPSSPFADNGAIPDRNQVAFMQQDGALSQMVSGFTVGAQYYVVYNENARSGGVPAIEVKIGDTTIVPAHSRSPVGGANPYIEVTSEPFAAESATLQLSFIKSNPNGGDTTALIDNVCILPMPSGTPPSVLRAPQSLIVSVGDNASFNVGAFGSLPFAYQWRKNGSDIPGATGTTLSLSTVSKSADADYTVVITNASGSVTSAVAHLTVWEPIATLFNTGLDSNRVALADGAVDPHYSFVSNPDTGSPNEIVEDSTVFPIVGGPWLANTASSKWIGPRLNTAASAVGFYTNRITFDLTNRDPSTVVIIGRWASDNTGRDIRVNGVSTGNPQNGGFTAYVPFVIATTNASFVPGLNTIDFVVENEAAIGYTGLRVEFTASNARFLPNIPPSIVVQPTPQTGVIEGNSVTFTVNASGTDPLLYQWSRNGSPLNGQTNASLTIAVATTADNGLYSVRVTNDFGFADSIPAQLTVLYRRVPGIYGTGLQDGGALAADGSVDLHWTLGASADPTPGSTGPEAYVINAANSPVPPWIVAGPKSKWIAPQPNQNAGNAEGNYTFQNFFDLTGVDLCTFRIAGQASVDNSLVDILVNGVSQGISGGGFSTWLPFTLTNGFVAGLNSVDFILNNAPATPNPTALRVDLDGLVRIRTLATLHITRTGPDDLSVSWAPTGNCDELQSAPGVSGPWTTVGTTNPTTVHPSQGQAMFLRVRQ